MVGLIITLGLALVWLGYETDWMTVRLLCGAEALIIEYEFKTWEQLKPWNPKFKQYPMWVVCPSNMAPLCGWDWLKNTVHIIPEYRIELDFGSYRQRITLKESSQKILKDVMRINTGKKFLARLV